VVQVLLGATNFIKTVLRVQCTLCSTLSSVWLGFVISSRMNLHSVHIKHHVKQVQYVKLQEDIFLTSLHL
jgi:hypothetical protein